VSFEPATVNQATGSTFTVNVSLAGASNVYSVPLQISYDPKTLALVNVSNGQFLSRDGQAVALVHRDDAQTGQLQVTATRPPGSGGVSGDGTVFTLTFMAKGAGQSTINVARGTVRDPNMSATQVNGSQAVVTIR
jgi:general secretion pathway protein D